MNYSELYTNYVHPKGFQTGARTLATLHKDGVYHI